MKIKNKWFVAFLIAAVALVVAVSVAIVIGVNSKPTPPDTPQTEDPTVIPDGPETGIYYYDVAGGEVLLSLNSGNKFTLAGPQINKSGEYTVEGNVITLDFVRDEDGTAQAEYTGDAVKLNYNDAVLNFIKKIYYKVTFNTNEGSAVEEASVLNGKNVLKPADPTKANSVFLGWYADEALTTVFDFTTAVITADTTVYAKWAATVVGQNEYYATFNLNYEGAEAIEALKTIGGKLYGVPTPAARQGYTFGGWYISDYEDATKLTYAYTEDTVLKANTTLFALWIETSSDKIAAPAVDVFENAVKWNAVEGATRYQIKVTNAKGETVLEEEIGATTQTVDFNNYPAGDYTVTVTALAANAANNSVVAVRCYSNKALDRVANAQVVNGIIVFGAVENAEKYIITVDCGNANHNHVDFDNGSSTNFSIVNCAMQKGGIKYTITAVANGYASSVSETFVYDRTLGAVSAIEYNKDTDTFVWNAVENAASYTVTVTVGTKTYTFDNGNSTSFSAANYTGEITVAVVPVTDGYNSPDAVSANCTKTVPAAPSGITVNGNVISWNAVEGATSYEVKIGDTTQTVNTTSFDLSTVTLVNGNAYAVSVKTLKDSDSSAYSEAVTVVYLAAPSVFYENNTVYWTPVLGAKNYEVRVNGVGVFTVSGECSATIKLEKAGINTIEVRYTDNGGCDWVKIEVKAFEVTYKSRSLISGDKYEYVAIGDKLNYPLDMENIGYNFNGWYNTPSASAGNGIKFENDVFTGNADLVLYADWAPKSYNIIFDTEGYDVTNMTATEKGEVVFGKNYTLKVPVSSNSVYEAFLGWFTGPGGSGVQLTDELGNSVGVYEYADDTLAYPHFNAGVLSYELQADGTYKVSAGVNFDKVQSVVIPQFYNGAPVTTIVENAFYNKKNVVKISIPDTIELVGVNAFTGADKLEEIYVYTIEGNHKRLYSSSDGALLRDDMGTLYLEAFPCAKTGTYTVPEGVQILRNKVFQWSKIETVIIASTVTSIQQKAFYRCENLKRIEFKGGRTSSIAFAEDMLYLTPELSELKLPAMIDEIDLDFFRSIKKLSSIEVEDGGTRYNSVDGMLTNALKDTLIYAPNTLSGEYKVPNAINYIADGAFANHERITSIVIPKHVIGIGNNAFAGCIAVTSITFEGGRFDNLTIGDSAFAGCLQLRTVTFGKEGATETDTGYVTIGNGAFAPASTGTNLREVTFGDGTNIKSIGNSAFADQTALFNIKYGNKIVIEAIGDSAFKNNTLLNKVEIHGTTKSVGASAFAGCSNVANVVFGEGGNGVSFGSGVFTSCTKLVKVELPSTITSFESSVFTGCNALCEITVASGNQVLTAINNVLYGIDANKNPISILFYPQALPADNASIKALPWSTITTIGNSVFAGRSELTEFEIPAGVTTIGDSAFSGSGLAKVSFADGGSAALTISSNAFKSCKSLADVQLPARTAQIGASAFESCAFASFTLPVNVTAIANRVFAANANLSSIVITDKITTIGQGAFYGCTGLASVTFEGNTALTLEGASGNGVFQGCQNLKSVDFNGRVSVLAPYTFASTGLTTVDLTGVTEIGASAFESTKLIAVTIPTSVVTIGNKAFASVSTLTSVEFTPGGSEELTLGSSLFTSTKLTEITFPARATNLYSYVPANSKTDFMVPDIADMFTSVTTLKNIYVEEGSTKYKSINGVLYELDENGNAATLLLCPVKNVGETINGKKTVVVPETVTLIANRAFYDVQGIQVVTIKSYPEDHENYKKQLLHVGAGVYNVSTISNTKYYYVFGQASATTNTIEKIEFPAHLAKLGVYTLGKIKGTVTLVFNTDAFNVEIGTSAFNQSGKVTGELNLPGISKLGTSAFQGCSKVTKITFAPTTTLTEIPGSAFSSCGATEIEIPASVVTLISSSFSSAKFTKVSFAEGSKLTSIGIMAFGANTSLKTIDFTNATKLTTIEGQAFNQCSSLTSVTIPASVTSIGGGAFNSCSKLTEVILPANYPASALQGYDPINYGNKSIFDSASKLAVIKIDAENEIGDQLRTVDGVLYDRNLTIVYLFPTAKSVEGYTMPETIKTIEFQAFKSFKGTSIELPDSLLHIKDDAFTGSSLTSITIPASVKEIGKAAFNNCKALTSVTFKPGSQLETIGDSAFANTYVLTSITLPDSVKSIGASAFSKSSLTEIVLPAALETLGNNAFQNCERLIKVTIQEKLKTIGNNAFENTALKTIVLPASVTTIGTKTFLNSLWLESVTFADGVRITSIPESTFEGCVNLKTVNVPATVTSVGKNAFKGNADLETLQLPDAVTDIADGAFDGATSLKNINVPASLKTIGTRAFAGTAITSFTFPSGVTSIGESAFEGCPELASVVFDANNAMTSLGALAIFKDTAKLTSVVLPSKLETFGANVFENSGITELNLPATVKSIGNYTFANCDGLTVVTIPGNTTNIGEYAFFDCDNLTVANLSFGLEYLGSLAFASCEKLTTTHIPSSVISVGANPYADCLAPTGIDLDPKNDTFIYENGMLFNYSKTVLYYYSPAKTDEVAVIPESVTEIAAGAFAGAQMKSIVIPAKLGTIPAYAFYGCTKLESVTIESGITAIGAHAFDGCTKLNNVTVPKTATSLGDYAFANATSLSSFTFEDTTSAAPYILGTHLFENCVSITEVIMPNFHNVTDDEANKYSIKSTAAKRQGMIPSYMFAGTGIVNAVLPSHVTFLSADGVFMNCKNLVSFSFEGVLDFQYIGSYFFYGCSAIEEISIPHGATNMLYKGEYTFAYCTSLKKVTLGLYNSYPSSYQTSSHMFEGCTSLTEIVAYKWTKKTTSGVVSFTYEELSLSYVGPYYFAGCTSLKDMTVAFVNATLTMPYIGEHAFDGCTGLETFTMKSYITSTSYVPAIKLLGDYAFAGCTKLTNLTFDVKLDYRANASHFFVIGEHVFDGWTADQTIKFAKNTSDEIAYFVARGAFKGSSAKVLDQNDQTVNTTN